MSEIRLGLPTIINKTELGGTCHFEEGKEPLRCRWHRRSSLSSPSRPLLSRKLQTLLIRYFLMNEWEKAKSRVYVFSKPELYWPMMCFHVCQMVSKKWIKKTPRLVAIRNASFPKWIDLFMIRYCVQRLHFNKEPRLSWAKKVSE